MSTSGSTRIGRRRGRNQDTADTLARALRGEHLAEPPAATLRRAIALAAELPRKRGFLSWVADLVFDSALSPEPSGVRAARRTERRLLYRATPRPRRRPLREAAELDLRLRRDAQGRVELTGQILPPWPGGRAVVRAGRLRRVARLGPHGEFLVKTLPARAESFRLEIEGPDRARLVLERVPAPLAGSTGRL